MRRKLSNNQLITLFSIVYLALILMVSVVVASRAERVETGADASFDQTATATGICCNGGVCNDGTGFGGDANAWHDSCSIRANEACQGHGGVRSGGGSCNGSTPSDNLCNDGSLADTCWVFICPFGCGGDGDDTTCNGDEPGATKQIVPCDQASLRNNVCGQVDFVKNGLYCGVKETQCNTDCIPSPTPTTTPRPTLTPPPVPPTASMTSVCTPNQTFGNLSYDLKLSNISPVSGFQSANFQMCINPGTNANHRLVYQDFFLGNANWKSSATTNGVPNWACYQLATVTQITTKDASISLKFNNTIYIGGTNVSWRRTINELVQYKTYYTHLRGTTYSLKAVLKTNGQVNDSISGGTIKIQNDACAQPPTPTKAPTPTLIKTPTPTKGITPTPKPTTNPQACTTKTTSPLAQYRKHTKLSNGTIVPVDDSNDGYVRRYVNHAFTVTKPGGELVTFTINQQRGPVPISRSATDVTCAPQPNEEARIKIEKYNPSTNKWLPLVNSPVIEFKDNNRDDANTTTNNLISRNGEVFLSPGTYRFRSQWVGDAGLYPNVARPYTNFKGSMVSYLDRSLGNPCQWNGSYTIQFKYCTTPAN